MRNNNDPKIDTLKAALDAHHEIAAFPHVVEELIKEEGSEAKLGGTFNLSQQAVSKWKTGKSLPEPYVYRTLWHRYDQIRGEQ
jgi:hypothetical protein